MPHPSHHPWFNQTTKICNYLWISEVSNTHKDFFNNRQYPCYRGFSTCAVPMCFVQPMYIFVILYHPAEQKKILQPKWNIFLSE
jgi:hypothetical protein